MPGPKTNIQRDETGRITHVKAHITRKHLDNGENVKYDGYKFRNEHGRDNDHAGHIIAIRLGGGGDSNNIVPLAPKTNHKMRTVENSTYQAVEKYNGTDVDVRMSYKGDSKRPHLIEYKATNKHVEINEKFYNINRN